MKGGMGKIFKAGAEGTGTDGEDAGADSVKNGAE